MDAAYTRTFTVLNGFLVSKEIKTKIVFFKGADKG